MPANKGSSFLFLESLQKLKDYACGAQFKEQMNVARELYFLSSGHVHEADYIYESRMDFFLEFFLFEFRLSDFFSGSTVYESFLFSEKLSQDEMKNFVQFRSLRQSVFTVQKVNLSNKHSIYPSLEVFDLLQRSKIHVFLNLENDALGFEVGQAFNGRVLNFEKIFRFTNSFIFHPKEITYLIEDRCEKFLETLQTNKKQENINWKEELSHRFETLSEIAKQRAKTEVAEKKRSIDLLNVTKKLAQLNREVSSSHLIMSLGKKDAPSVCVAENPAYDVIGFLNDLAYCEVKTLRYKHIEPSKVYELVVKS
jgi:hypothetical protein